MSEMKWISVDERRPATGDILVIFNNGEHGYLFWGENDSVFDRQVRWWMPFPKRESSFERYWEMVRRDNDVVGRMMREPRQTARFIWDAAIAAFQRGDYVP